MRVKLKPLQHGAGVLFCDPVFIGLTVAVNAIGFFASSHLAAPLGERFGMVAGGVTISLTGLYFDGAALPKVAAMALCALSAWGWPCWCCRAWPNSASKRQSNPEPRAKLLSGPWQSPVLRDMTGIVKGP